MTNIDTPLTNADFSQRSAQATTSDQFRLRWSPRSMSGQALTIAEVQSAAGEQKAAQQPTAVDEPMAAVDLKVARRRTNSSSSS